MKINRLETHDRFLEFKKQSDYISKGCADCIANRPKEFGNRPFYIFAHSRQIGQDEMVDMFTRDHWDAHLIPGYKRKYNTIDDVPTSRFLWSPRLTKPVPQENSMLFKAYPPGDNIKVIWIIPAKELWAQYLKGKMTEDSIICESIDKFINNKKELEATEPDDLPDDQIDRIYLEISRNNTKFVPID